MHRLLIIADSARTEGLLIAMVSTMIFVQGIKRWCMRSARSILFAAVCVFVSYWARDNGMPTLLRLRLAG